MDTTNNLENYFKFNPMDTLAIEKLLVANSEVPLTTKNLRDIITQCLDYRLLANSSKYVKDIKEYSMKELVARKVYLKYATLPSLADTFDFLLVCIACGELAYFKKILEKSRYSYIIDLPSKRNKTPIDEKGNEYVLLWEAIIYYYLNVLTNQPVDMLYVSKFSNNEKIDAYLANNKKLNKLSKDELIYYTLTGIGYCFIELIMLIEATKMYDNLNIYFEYKKQIEASLCNALSVLYDCNLDMDYITIEYFRKIFILIVMYPRD